MSNKEKQQLTKEVLTKGEKITDFFIGNGNQRHQQYKYNNYILNVTETHHALPPFKVGYKFELKTIQKNVFGVK
jgi:hypothetical protein